MTPNELLRRAGWEEGRQVAANAWVAGLRDGGFESWTGLASMLAEYCFLVVHDAEGLRSLWIDPARAIADADADWVAGYERSLGVRLAPVGGYSHMLLMFGRDCVFYGGFDREFGPLGLTLEEAVDGLLCRVPPVRLAMRLE